MSNFLFCLIVVLFATLVNATDVRPDQMALEVRLNDGLPTTDGSFCTAEEYQYIVDNATTALFPNSGRRSLRDDTERRLNCANWCRGFASGYCFVVYKQCVGWRREMVENEDDVDIEDVADDEDDESLAALGLEQIKTQEGGIVTIETTSAAATRCEEEKEKLEITWNKLLEDLSLSQRCKEVMSKELILECLVV